MQITMFGAAGEVTGSCSLLETGLARVLIDCGMVQGADAAERNQLPPDLDVTGLDAVVISHAHLDHIGRLPLLVRAGYRGPIYATPATIDLVGLLLADAAHIQANDLERLNRRRERAGREPLPVLFDDQDVADTLARMRPVPYEQPSSIAPSTTLRLVEAGHILGSASIVLTATAEGRERVLVFSGDLGPRGAPILQDPAVIEAADLVMLESTYGDRDHRTGDATLAELVEVLQRAIERRGKVLIPAFAVGRTQALLYHLAALFREGKLPPLPVYLDSPLATRATELYRRYPGLADAESLLVRTPSGLWHGLETLQISRNAADSQALNSRRGPCIIIAGAGMCTGGRILHHFRHQLWRPETLVLIVGYQAEGTLGRQLVEGAKYVQIFGEEIVVQAEICTLGGLSAHAGQSELVEWLRPMARTRPQVILNHGEDQARRALARRIQTELGLQPALPMLGDTISLAEKGDGQRG